MGYLKCLERSFGSLMLCLLVSIAVQAEQPRSAAVIRFSDDPNLENTTASSSYVPLDSWVYPAMERLYSLGYLDTAFLGLRPWTRISCARMLAETEEKAAASESPYVVKLFNSLTEEFAGDLAALGSPAHGRLESIYARGLQTSGAALADSEHFGQTIINDYGRPFEQGFNSVTGFSGYAGAGRFSLQIQGEYQHAPGRAAYPDSVRSVIAQMDGNPELPPTPVSPTNAFALLDANVSMHELSHEISVGKVEDWWGPGQIETRRSRESGDG